MFNSSHFMYTTTTKNIFKDSNHKPRKKSLKSLGQELVLHQSKWPLGDLWKFSVLKLKNLTIQIRLYTKPTLMQCWILLSAKQRQLSTLKHIS